VSKTVPDAIKTVAAFAEFVLRVLRFIMAFFVCAACLAAGAGVYGDGRMRGTVDGFNDRQVISMDDRGDGASVELSHRYGSR
jgi:hypothetical protein